MSTTQTPAPRRLALSRAGLALTLAAVIAFLGALAVPGAIDRLVPDGVASSHGESGRAKQLLSAYLGREPEPAMVVTASSSLPPRSPVRGVAMAAILSQLQSDPAVVTVHRGPSSSDGRAASFVVFFGRSSQRDRAEASRRIAGHLDGGPLKLAVGGRYPVLNAVAEKQKSHLAKALAGALPIAFLLLALLTGSLVRAGIGMLAGAVSLLAGVGALTILQAITDVPVSGLFAAGFVSSLLGVQHGLLVQSAHSREIADGQDPDAALQRAVRSAWRSAVLCSMAAGTVIGAVALLPDPAARSAALPGAIAAVLAPPSAVLTATAAVAVLGDRLDAGRIRAPGAPNPAGSLPYRLATGLMPVRWPLALAVIATLAGLAIPLQRVHLSAVDSSLVPKSAAARADSVFGSGLTAPVLITAVGHDRRQLSAYASRVAAVPGVAAASPPQVVGNDLRLVEAATRGDPGSASARRAVSRIRALNPSFPVSVGGVAAQAIDQRHAFADRFPIGVIFVLVVAAAVIAVLTGGLAAGVKTGIVLVLGPLATAGALVLSFGEDRLSGVLDYVPRGGVSLASLLVVMVTGIAAAAGFVCSVLSSMAEEREAGAEDREQVARGVEAAAPAAVGGALATGVVAVALMASAVEPVKEVGTGVVLVLLVQTLAAGMVLAPALFGIGASANWWPGRFRAE